MSVAVTFPGAFPLAVAGWALDGYHRPLNGEVANLTVSAAYDQFLPEWLANPPLGAACTVTHDGATVMDGYLYGVRVQKDAVQLRVEG